MQTTGAKGFIVRCFEEADEHEARGTYENAIIALTLHTNSLERLLNLEYARMGRAGVIVPFLQKPATKQKCDSVVTGLKAEGFSNGWVTEKNLSLIVPLGGRARHAIYPRIDASHLAVALMLTRGAISALFKHYYGEMLPDPDDYVSEHEIDIDDVLPFIFSGVRRRLAGVLIESEMDIYDLLKYAFISGSADWATLRRMGTYGQLIELGRRPVIALMSRIHEATLAEAEWMVADEALRVLSDLKTLITTEARCIRMQCPGVSIPLSDVDIALCSVHERLGVLRNEQDAA